MGSSMVVSRRVRFRRVGADIVIMEVGKGELFSLSGIGAEVWEGIAGGIATTEIVRKVVEQYDVEPVKALADVTALMKSFAANGLVVETESE